MDKLSVKIKCLDWKQISQSTKDRLLNMTFSGGTMRHFVLDTDPVVFVAYSPGHHGKRVGWSAWDLISGRCMFFILDGFRRRGIASAIIKEISLKVADLGLNTPRFTGWDYDSDSFGAKQCEAGTLEIAEWGDCDKYLQEHYRWKKR